MYEVQDDKRPGVILSLSNQLGPNQSLYTCIQYIVHTHICTNVPRLVVCVYVYLVPRGCTRISYMASVDGVVCINCVMHTAKQLQPHTFSVSMCVCSCIYMYMCHVTAIQFETGAHV